MAAEEMETDYEVHGKSDLTLTSDSDLFYVHQTVVCAQSPVLRDKCATMKVSFTVPHTLLKETGANTSADRSRRATFPARQIGQDALFLAPSQGQREPHDPYYGGCCRCGSSGAFLLSWGLFAGWVRCGHGQVQDGYSFPRCCSGHRQGVWSGEIAGSF